MFRRALLAPFVPYYRYVGAEQNWRMFIAPHKHPSHLQIHVRSGPKSEWEPLYEHGHATLRWRESQLAHTRMRSALFRYSWPSYRRNYRALARWVGRQVAQEQPEAEQVRLQWVRQRSLAPHQVRAGKSPKKSIIQPYVVTLSGLRP